MKKLLILFSLLSNFAFALEKYTIDPQHTFVLFHINHLSFSNQSGKWYAQGTLLLDESNIENSKVNVSINVAKVITGIPELDKHLKGKEFFNVKKHALAKFVSNKITSNFSDKFEIEGILTLNGIARPVTLKAIKNKVDINPISLLKTAGFSATTTINRSDFNIKAYLPDISDEVQLEIELEANLLKK